MDPENTVFEEFFAARLKHKGLTIKKLGEITGISPSHLQELARADFSALPSAPYVHGYLVRIGKVLDFDGEEWWNRIKEEGLVRNSGPTDALPRNRFARQSPMKLIGLGIIALLIIIYLIIQFPLLWGTPTILILSPVGNPATSQESIIAIKGTVKNADSLYLTYPSGVKEEITIAPDRSWQKDVLLTTLGQEGNNFKITAKKFLHNEADIIENVVYEPPVGANGNTGATTTPATAPQTTTDSTQTPATTP
jgi:cytoskeletal protein RodZ